MAMLNNQRVYGKFPGCVIQQSVQQRPCRKNINDFCKVPTERLMFHEENTKIVSFPIKNGIFSMANDG